MLTDPGSVRAEWVHPLNDQNHSQIGINDEEDIPPPPLGPDQNDEQYEVSNLAIISIENS